MRSTIHIRQLIKMSALSFIPNISEMSKIIYNKKSELLEDLGKDRKDTRYLDRAMERWEIVMIDGYYMPKDALVGKVVEILVWENSELKKEIEKVSENFSDNSEELNEAKINAEYYKNEAEEERDKRVALESVLDGLREKGISIGYWE